MVLTDGVGDIAVTAPAASGIQRCPQSPGDVDAREPAPPPSSGTLTPELKSFIDRVIVPILVKDYLAQVVEGNLLASNVEAPDNPPIASRSIR
jgi:hypothetical protein